MKHTMAHKNNGKINSTNDGSLGKIRVSCDMEDGCIEDERSDTDSTISIDNMSYGSISDVLQYDTSEDEEKLNIEKSDNTVDSNDKQHFGRLGEMKSSKMKSDETKSSETKSSEMKSSDQHENGLRLHEIISRFLENPSDVFILRGLHTKCIPSLVGTFEMIKELIINNCNLVTLDHIPPLVEKIDIRYNKLTCLRSSMIPSTVKDINASRNNIIDLDLEDSPNLKILNVSINPLGGTVKFPPMVEDLNVTSSNIDTIDGIKKLSCLSVLKINITHISNIDDLPDNITDLSLSRILLGKTGGIVQKLPRNIVKLIAHSAGIKRFEFHNFPENLSHLDLYDNELTEIPKLNDIMCYIDLSKNKLVRLSNIPHKFQNLDCSENPSLVFTDEQTKTLTLIKKESDVTIILNDDGIIDTLGGVRSVQSGQSSQFVQCINRSPLSSTFREKCRFMQHGSQRITDVNIVPSLFSTAPYTTDSSDRTEQRTQTQSRVMKILMSDNFSPSCDINRKIKHDHIYHI